MKGGGGRIDAAVVPGGRIGVPVQLGGGKILGETVVWLQEGVEWKRSFGWRWEKNDEDCEDGGRHQPTVRHEACRSCCALTGTP